MDNCGSISVFNSSILQNSDLRIRFYAVVSRTLALVFFIRYLIEQCFAHTFFTQLYLAPQLEDGQPR